MKDKSDDGSNARVLIEEAEMDLELAIEASDWVQALFRLARYVFIMTKDATGPEKRQRVALLSQALEMNVALQAARFKKEPISDAMSANVLRTVNYAKKLREGQAQTDRMPT